MPEDRSEKMKKILETNAEFRRLYDIHSELKNRVADAQVSHAIDDAELAVLKREKLHTKDKMEAIIHSYTDEG